MDTLTFLQRVLPTEGLYVTTIINPDGNRQGFFTTVDDLAKAVVKLDQLNNNTYFAISAFMEKGSRKQDNVRCTKVLALDVDCGTGKPFPSWREGLIALGNFIKVMALPKPMIVHSGNGLHVYWVLTEELSPDRWKPLALALKAATIDKGFNVDAALTANSALVLRPVGTHNPKNGNEVKLLIDAPDVDVSTIFTALSNYMVVAQPVSHRPTTSALAQSLAVQQDFPPGNATIIATKCNQISTAIANQADIKEPFWYKIMGVAAYCQDADATAIAWSENHPTFNPTETVQKMHQWKQSTSGPTTCKKFEEDNAAGCAKCKYKGKIGSPIRLGAQYQEVAPPANALDTTAHDVPMPKPFKRTADGIKMTIDDTDIDVCRFDIYPVSYGKDESLGYETVRYHWNRPHMGWQELSMRQAYLTDAKDRDFATIVADQGIVLNNKFQTANFQLMLRSYMDELRQKRAMTNLYSSFGWKENFSQFVIGDTILRRNADGSVSEESINLASSSHRLGTELYGTAGDPKAWTQFTTLLDKADMRAHMFSLCVGLSAPLYAFTGLKGLTISLYGPTGGGKTLAQYWVQSLFGNPEKLHFAAKFTQNTLFGRMGLYAHMPMTIDEVTMMDNKEVGDFAYWVSQGRDKARLNRNAEERDAKTWAMPVMVSTNKSMNSKLIASGLDTDAQMARILEVSVPQHKLFAKDTIAGRKIYEFVTTNYGHIGRLFVAKLLELGQDGVRAAIANYTATFAEKYKTGFSGEERYYEQAIVLADMAGHLATEWGLFDFQYQNGIEWVLSQVGAIRRTVADFKIDAHDLLTEYLNDTADAQVQVFHTGMQKPTIDYSRIPRGEVRVRFDMFRKNLTDQFDHGTVMIDRTHFRKWLANRGADYKTFIQNLTDENVIATPKSQKAYLAKDTPIKLGQSYVIGINLVHPRTMGMLDEADEAYENLALGQLKAVT